MQVPRLIAPGLTFGAALSNNTPERPYSSLPVTTRRIGRGSEVSASSPCIDILPALLSRQFGPRCFVNPSPRAYHAPRIAKEHRERARTPRRAMEDPLRRLRMVLPVGVIACALISAWALTRAAPGFAADPAQNFPDRPIKIIVGPSPDVFSRIVGERLQQVFGQPVVVEPRPGAGGKIAASAVQNAAPDGYTLLFATPTYTINTAMKLASYDLLKDFAPVALSGLISYALVVHPSVPAKSVAELVAYAKANPGKLNCASAGIGTVPQIACAYLNKLAGTNIIHVPFRDVNSGMVATVGNTTQMFFGVATNAKPQ